MKPTHPWNKTTLSGSIAALALACSMIAHAKDAPGEHDFPALNGERKAVVVVVRHGEDLPNGSWIEPGKEPKKWMASTWKTTVAPQWPSYSLPSGVTAASSPSGAAPGNGLIFLQHGLSEEGEAQADFLAKNLQGLVRELNGLPITRVITKRPDVRNPDGSLPTPNPFDTIYPFLKYGGFQGGLCLIEPRVDKTINPLVDKGLAQILPDFETQPPKTTDALRDGVGSTLLCWDAEGLWGKDEKEINGKSYRVWSDDSILDKLSTPAIDDYLNGGKDENGTTRPNLSGHEFGEGKGVPGKAARIYLFYPRKEPKGYDCIVVDVKKNSKGQRELEMIAEVWVNETGDRSAKVLSAVLKHTEQAHAAAAAATPVATP